MRRFLCGCVATAWLFVAFAATAQEDVIGYVKTLQGTAQLVTGSTAQPLKAGMPLRLGQVLKTANPGSVGVTLSDNTQLSVGPDTELTLDEYLFAPAKGDLKLGLKLAKGSMYFVSGVISKLRPDAVSIKTPTGLIGVRGTQFLVRAEPEPKP